MQIRIPVSVGELLDKISILRIKSRRLSDPDKLANVRRELDALTATWGEAGSEDATVRELRDELEGVNEELWEIEDAIREKEARQEFDDEFVSLARSVYLTNDRRSGIKRALNLHLGSELVEEKSYADYRRGVRAEDASGSGGAAP